MSKGRLQTDFQFETESGFNVVAGVDEAGRGPLCGPVVAAAVVFSPLAKKQLTEHRAQITITDSKKMSAKQREVAYDWIIKNCTVGIGQCSPVEIDELNILWASMLAMKRAIDALPVAPEFVLVDGNRLPDGICPPSAHETVPPTPPQGGSWGRAIVGGDAKSISIAAASIVAKVTRDRIMSDLAAGFPQYGWDKNAGYPTSAHLENIKKYGINEHYRKTFGPVKKLTIDNV